jgi:hypothetical protein
MKFFIAFFFTVFLFGFASAQRNLFLHGGALGDFDFDVGRQFVEASVRTLV